MSKYKKPTYIIIQEAMADRIRFLEDELYNRAYKDIERQEAEIDRLKEKCVNLLWLGEQTRGDGGQEDVSKI